MWHLGKAVSPGTAAEARATLLPLDMSVQVTAQAEIIGWFGKDNICFIWRPNPQCCWLYQPRVFCIPSNSLSVPQRRDGLIEVPSVSL